MRRVRVVIRGRVQGVGFRVFALRQARALDLSGEVRNQPDGSVEVWAEGDPDVLRDLVERLRQGPAAAHVTALDESWSDGSPSYRGFEIRG